jgi:hypothetical protein
MGGNPFYSLICKFLFGINDSEQSMCEGFYILNSLLATHSRLVLCILLPLYPFTNNCFFWQGLFFFLSLPGLSLS